MLPIAPLDYERYAVAHSPYLVPNSGSSVPNVPTGEAAPVEQLPTKLSRHNFSLQGSNQHAGANAYADGKTRVGEATSFPLISPLSVELSSVAGVSLDVIKSPIALTKLNYQAVSEHYQLPEKITTTVTIRFLA